MKFRKINRLFGMNDICGHSVFSFPPLFMSVPFGSLPLKTEEDTISTKK